MKTNSMILLCRFVNSKFPYELKIHILRLMRLSRSPRSRNVIQQEKYPHSCVDVRSIPTLRPLYCVMLDNDLMFSDSVFFHLQNSHKSSHSTISVTGRMKRNTVHVGTRTTVSQEPQEWAAHAQRNWAEGSTLVITLSPCHKPLG